MKRLMSYVVASLLAGASACEAGVVPEITRFQSHERITHLVQSGANAAREIDVEVRLFDEAGMRTRLAGYPITIDAYDDDSATYAIGTLSGYTDASGSFAGRITLASCRSPRVRGPVRLHRISNRPEYWDITYTEAGLWIGPVRVKPVRFVHICKETYRGTRP